MQQGILDALKGSGFELVVHPCNRNSPTLLEDIRGFVERQRLYGVIMPPSVSEDEQVIDLLRELAIPVAPLRSTDELFENEHLNDIGFFEKVASPYGEVTFPGVPTWFSASPGKVRGPAPALGENNAEILAELGL